VIAPSGRLHGAASRLRCYRCSGCLDVVFASESCRDGVACGACGGGLEFLGRVTGDRLTATVEQCACDGRCTGAVGPQCSCQCGGVNHGTGRLVEVVRDLGAVPRLTGQRGVAHLVAVAAEWLTVVGAARSALAALPEWERCRYVSRLSAARELRTQKARLAAIAKLLASIAGNKESS